jgi:hypothetical protein
VRRPALIVSVLLLALVPACSDDGGSKASASPPEITAATLEPNPANAISAVLHVETTAASQVAATVEGPGGSFEVPADASATEHTIPVVGMRATSDYTVTMHATAEAGGTTADRTLEITTGALPADLPPITVGAANGKAMAPGYTVFNAMPWAPVPKGQPNPDSGYIIVVDATGAVVWYAKIPLQILDIDTSPRGTFLVTAGDATIQEVDLFGHIVRDWGSRVATVNPKKNVVGQPLSTDKTKPIEVDSTHHEVTELPNGDLLTLSTELLHLSDADAKRLCPDNPETAIVGDIAVELTPDGKVVQRWPLSKVYDPTTTPGSEMCVVGPPVAPPNWFYPDDAPTRDWTHANAIALDAKDNTIIVSSRHLDRILGLRYHDDGDGKAGELLWSLGVGGTIKIDGEPPHHQHAVELEDDGSLMMYDNGNLRPGTTLAGGTAPPFSRAVRYSVDLKAGTAKQVWEHRDSWPDGRPIYTPFLGDVDLEPNGNVLITHGGGSSAKGVLMGRIIEVTPGDAADGSKDTTVFDITVGDGTGQGGWTLYRAERLASLYFGKAS